MHIEKHGFVPLHTGLQALALGTTCAVMLWACSCSSSGTGSGESASLAESVTEAEQTVAEAEATFHADNDIAMAVRSMADAINVGEPLDSTDYNFQGVLTDGIGAPLFTDFEGFPGEWEVSVVSPSEVKIRNIGVGDLFPDGLVEYLAHTLAPADTAAGEDPELIPILTRDEGDTRIEEYAYGRTRLRIATSPQELPTGEVAPRLEITLTADTMPTADATPTD